MQNNQQMYVWKIMLQKFTIKNEKPNSNINISRIPHLTFDMLCYLLEIMMAQWKFHSKLASTLKQTVVQNCAPGTVE